MSFDSSSDDDDDDGNEIIDLMATFKAHPADAGPSGLLVSRAVATTTAATALVSEFNPFAMELAADDQGRKPTSSTAPALSPMTMATVASPISTSPQATAWNPFFAESIGNDIAGGGGEPRLGGAPDNDLTLFGGVPSVSAGQAAPVPKDLPPTHVSFHSYAARESDEVTLNKGDHLFVLETSGDGWFVGQNLATGQVGTWPGNFCLTMAEHTARQQDRGKAQPQIAPQQQQQQPGEGPARDASAGGARVGGRPRVDAHDDEALARRLQAEEHDTRQLDVDLRLARHLQEEEDHNLALQAAGQLAGPKQAPAYIAAPDYEEFIVRFLGSLEGCQPQGTGVVVQCIRQVQAERKANKISVKKYFVFRVSADGITMIDTEPPRKRAISIGSKQKGGELEAPQRTQGRRLTYPLRNIAFCAFDPDDPKYFGFVSKEPSGKQCGCHVFKFDRSSVTIINALGTAFRLSQRAPGQLRHSLSTSPEWLGETVLDSHGEIVPVSSLAPVIGLYFGAGWCEPCRQTLPALIQAYDKARATGLLLDIVFVSNDHSADEYASYRSHSLSTTL